MTAIWPESKFLCTVIEVVSRRDNDTVWVRIKAQLSPIEDMFWWPKSDGVVIGDVFEVDMTLIGSGKPAVRLVRES